jgi:hypothetical protein
VRFDDIGLIIYPRQRPGPLVSPAGHVVDHLAFAVSDLDQTLSRLAASGVTVPGRPHPFGRTGSDRTRSVEIEGPDAMSIELVERP